MMGDSGFPLVWIIDVLARSQLVSLSVLIDLSSKIPKSSDPVVTNLREVVSFRILESIHTQQPTSTLKSLTINPSKYSCLDILQHIIKDSRSNFKLIATVMSKLDVEPFLKHKKSSLPKCTLLKIKDAFLNGNPPHLAPLREQSGLPLRNQPRPGSKRTVAPNMRTSQIPSGVPTLSKIVEESPSKHQRGNAMKSAEKHKPDKIYSEKKQIPHSLNKSNVETSQKSIAANANGYRKSISTTDKNERFRQEPNSDDQGQHEHEQTANVNMDELDQGTQINVSNAEKRESCIASDRHNEQMADISKKEGFISSQCTLSQDSVADSFLDSELMLCLKCNRGEKLLVCSNSCALAIHESCMLSGVSFHKDGKFCCPFCAFSLALSDYKEVQAKVSAARNELSKFVSAESGKKTEKQSRSRNNLNQVDSLPKKTDLKGKAICKGKLYREKAGPSEGGLPSKGKEVGSTNGTPCTKSNDKQVKKRTRQVTHSPRVIRKRQTREQAILKSQNEKAVHEISEIRSKKGVSGPTETIFHCENKSSASDDSANEEEISEYSSDNSFDPGASEDDVRVIKIPDKQCLLRAQKRRFRWTSEEENKLQEAMEALYDEENTTIPWTKILEYGAGTFHERRTAVHLKDKWRNMCKKAKKQ